MKTRSLLTALVVLFGLAASVYAEPPNPMEGPLGLVTGPGNSLCGSIGFRLDGSGANTLIRIEPVTGATGVITDALPSGIQSFAAALDSAGSRYFYRTRGNLIVVNTQTGALVGSLSLPENLVSLDFDPASGTLLGLVTGPGRAFCGNVGLILNGSGANALVRIDPATGAISVITDTLPSGIINFAAALDSAGSRYFYRTGGNLIVVDTQTGAVLASWPLPDNLISLDFDPASGTLLGLATGPGQFWFGSAGFILKGSGANTLVRIDPVTGTTSVVGDGLPSGIFNFVATLDPAGSRYFYQTRGSPVVVDTKLIVVDTQTGALVRALPLPENLISLNSDTFVVMMVNIDVKPGDFPNSINPKSNGVITVTILTADTFDATTVDSTTITFGVTGTEATPVQSGLEDIDGDGDIDAIFHFRVQDTGIRCEDTSASLTGKTLGGQAIKGSDSIKPVGCN